MFNHIFILTTYQYPHFEHMCSDIIYLSSQGKKVLVINLINSKYFLRSDLQWKNIRRFFSLHIRNTKLSPRVRFFLRKIIESSAQYLEEIKDSGSYKLDNNIKNSIYESASNYVSHWENSYFVDHDRSEIFSNILIKYFSVFYKSFSAIFEKNRNAVIHLFNGRFPIEYNIKKIFLKSHKVLIYECNEFNHKCIRKLDTVHMLNGFSDETYSLDKMINSNLKNSFVNALIEYKRKGKTISKEKFDFIFYTTNLDEYYFTGHSLDQIKFLQKFCSSFPKDSKVAIRFHPNTRNKNRFDKFYWRTYSEFLKSKGINIFSFENNIDSYSLSGNQSLSYSLGSTIGGELIFKDYFHYFLGDNTPFSLDKGVISLNPNEIEKNGFPVKKIFNKYKINKDIIASSLMIYFFIGEDFEYNLFRNTKNKLYKHMFSLFPELFNDKNLSIGIKQKSLIDEF